MKKLIFSPFLLAAIALTGCCFDPEAFDVDSPGRKSGSDCLEFDTTNPIQLTWQKPLLSDTGETHVIPFVFGDKVLLAYSCPDDGALKAVDVKTAATLWQTNDAFLLRYAATIPFYDSKLVVQDNRKIQLLDLNTGARSTIAEIPKTHHLERQMSVLGDELFFVIQTHTDSLSYGLLMQLNLANVDGRTTSSLGDTIHIASLKSCWAPSFSAPVFEFSPGGDTLLACVILHYNYWNTREDLLIYHFSKRKIMHYLTEIGRHKVLRQPSSRGNMIYLAGQAIECFNMFTGKRLWETPSNVMVNISRSILLPENENLIVSTYNSAGDYDLFVLDAKTGTEKWRKPMAFNGEISMVAKSGDVLYYLSRQKRITALEIATGKEIWQVSTPNLTNCSMAGYPSNEPILSNGIAIHPDLDYLMATDKFFAMAIQLPAF